MPATRSRVQPLTLHVSEFFTVRAARRANGLLDNTWRDLCFCSRGRLRLGGTDDATYKDLGRALVGCSIRGIGAECRPCRGMRYRSIQSGSELRLRERHLYRWVR